ncbi:MAG: hypothetical protein K2O12_00780, partial [Muribaculaceae bacterium]|nr:hypothetical protein [Muribaculaceae bacterium]
AVEFLQRQGNRLLKIAEAERCTQEGTVCILAKINVLTPSELAKYSQLLRGHKAESQLLKNKVVAILLLPFLIIK